MDLSSCPEALYLCTALLAGRETYRFPWASTATRDGELLLLSTTAMEFNRTGAARTVPAANTIASIRIIDTLKNVFMTTSETAFNTLG